jgi:hypothetical protein
MGEPEAQSQKTPVESALADIREAALIRQQK